MHPTQPAQPDSEIETARNAITNAVVTFLNGVASSPETHQGGLAAAAHDGQPKDHDVTGISVPCTARFMPNGTIMWWFRIVAINGQGMFAINGAHGTWEVLFPDPHNGQMLPVTDSINIGSALHPTQLTTVAAEVQTHLRDYAQAWFPQAAPTTMMTVPQQAPAAYATPQQPVTRMNVRQLLGFKTPLLATVLAFLALCIGVFGVIPGTAAAVSLGLQWRDLHLSRRPITSNPWLIAATAVVAIIFLIFCYNTVQTLMEANQLLNNPEQPTW